MVLEMADINHGIWEIGCALVCSVESQSKIERCRARLCLLASLLSASQGSTAGPVETGDAGGGEKLSALSVFALRDTGTCFNGWKIGMSSWDGEED